MFTETMSEHSKYYVDKWGNSTLVESYRSRGACESDASVRPGESHEHGTVFWTCEEHVETYEEWVYNPGPTHFVQYLTFKDGCLKIIRLGGYGG